MNVVPKWILILNLAFSFSPAKAKDHGPSDKTPSTTATNSLGLTNQSIIDLLKCNAIVKGYAEGNDEATIKKAIDLAGNDVSSEKRQSAAALRNMILDFNGQKGGLVRAGNDTFFIPVPSNLADKNRQTYLGRAAVPYDGTHYQMMGVAAEHSSVGLLFSVGKADGQYGESKYSDFPLVAVTKLQDSDPQIIMELQSDISKRIREDLAPTLRGEALRSQIRKERGRNRALFGSTTS